MTDLTTSAPFVSSKETPLVILTGGGTGGHIYPNLALLPDFKAKGFEIAYVGAAGDSMEKRLAALNGLNFYAVDTVKFSRGFSLSAIKNNLYILPKLVKSRKQATQLFERLKPDAVFSKGGFVSLPSVLAAKKLGIPCFCHESDCTLGLANKVAALTGAKVFKTNPHSRFKGEFTGMPVRRELFGITQRQAKSRLNIATDRKIVLFIGGSSGAAALNEAVYRNLEALTEKYFILHLCGKNKTEALDTFYTRGQIDTIRKNYVRAEYADDIAPYYASADLTVSRAGATAVFELSALRRRALFIPLPKGASRGDQLFNAALAKEYGADVLYQKKGFEKQLPSAVEKALKASPMRRIICDANGKIAEIVYASIRRGDLCSDKKQ
jgi:UDP-N-acetylglucosamine--N-acetylmuramyl-(pentapeptide) pyrophosphoryl-undecaprenol N-acetylglucosamine transferase